MEKSEGLDEYFWNSLLADIEKLRFEAGIHSRIFGIYRKLSKIFPYAIYYEIDFQNVYVIAVLPMKSSPEKTLTKLKNRI